MGARFQQSPWVGMLVGVAALARRRRGHRLSVQPPEGTRTSRSRPSRSRRCCSSWPAAGARFTAGSEGIPVPFRPGFGTLGLGDVGVGLPGPGGGAALLGHPGLAGALALRLSPGRRARGRGRGAGARHSVPPPQGHRGDGQRGADLRVRDAVGAVRRLRGSLLRLLGRSLGALRAQRHHRRHGHRARPLPRLDPDHVARDLSARHAVRREVGLHRHLPDRLRGRPDPRRALRPGGARGPEPPGCARAGRGPRREPAPRRPSCSASSTSPSASAASPPCAT